MSGFSPLEGTLAIDDANRLASFSTEAAELAGTAPAALLGQPFSELFDEGDRETATDILNRVRSGEINDTSLRLHLVSQQPAWIHLSRSSESSGSITGWIHRDRRVRGEVDDSLQADRLRLLATITSQSGPFQEILEQALRLTSQLLGYDIAICSQIKGDTYTVLSCHAPEAPLSIGDQFGVGETYCALTLEHRDLLEIDHMGESAHRRHPCYGAFGLESYVGIPIRVKEKVYGTLNFSSAEPRAEPLTTADDDLIRLLALWIGSAIEREQTHETLMEGKQRLKTLSESTFEGIFFSDAGVILDCNEQGARLFGFRSRKACIGLTLKDMVPPESLPKVREMALGKRPEAYEIQALRQNGDLFWAEVQGRPTPYKGQTVRLTAIRDISKRRQAQEQTRFQASVLAHVSDAVVALDLNGHVTYWNEGAAQLHGLAPEAVMGRRFNEVVSYSLGTAPSDQNLDVQPLAPHMALQQASEQSHDLVYITPTGDRRLVAVSASTLYDQQGNESGLLAVVRDETVHRDLEQELWHQARHDTLTGLPNRLRLREVIQDALEQDAPFSVLFVDLDRFKTVNDSLGHDVGDLLLQHVATSMSEVITDGIVSRMGGDEFAVVLYGSAPEAHITAAALVKGVQKPLVTDPHTLSLTASIGIVDDARTYSDSEALLRDADTAMYEAKRQGRDQAVAFESELHTRATARFSLEHDLRRAIREDELRVHFQPIVDLASGDLVGFESLVRWQDPARGLRGPDAFLPLAEELGLVAEIDSWVMDATCREMGTWAKDSDALLMISVNCSDQSFLRESLADRARAAAEQAGIAPERVVLELTERALVDSEAAAGALERLRNHGLKLSIDDFGSGYSSLGLLHRLPVDALKIDRSFVSDLETSPQARAIVRAVSDLARELGLRVTAEGIETAAQLEAVRDAGCHLGQGYYFSHPVPPEAAARMLTQPPWQTHWPCGSTV